MNAPNSMQIQLKRKTLPYLVVLALILQLFIPYRGWLVLLVGLSGAWLLGYWWARTLGRHLRLQREVKSTWVQAGDTLVESFALQNNAWARGVWVELSDDSTLPNYQGRQVLHVDAYNTLKWRVESVCKKRGLFTLGPTAICTADPLGLFSVQQHYLDLATMIITPRIVSLPGIEVAPGGRAGLGRPKATLLEPTVSAAGVRDYYPGDSLHKIHWPTSARRDSLYVRLFDNTPAGDWWIFLDMDSQIHLGEGDSSTEEHGVILAASLADRGLSQNRAVGLVTCGQEMVWLPPRHDDTQRWRILRALALIKPGSQSLKQLLTQTRPALGQSASIIIISSAIKQDWLQTLPLLVKRGITPTVLLFDPVAFGGQTTPLPILAGLTALNVRHYLISPDLLNTANGQKEAQL